MEALEMPKESLDVFLELDTLFGKMQRQAAKKKTKDHDAK
jgi:ribosome-associated translation inhibitor RaiA